MTWPGRRVRTLCPICLDDGVESPLVATAEMEEEERWEA